MSWQIGMPNLGHTMEEGTVAKWQKQVGDVVEKGHVIVTVESDKASFEVDSPADGVLLAILANDGAVVPVGAIIGIVGAPGEAVTAEYAPAPTSRVEPESGVTAGAPVPLPRAERADRVRISPAARRLAEELGIDPRDVVASDENGVITRDDVLAHSNAVKSADSAGIPLTPMRRAIARATEHAWQTIPHVALTSQANVGPVADSGQALTAAIGLATALALLEHGNFNGWLIDGAFRPSDTINLAFAMATPGGVLAAVVSDAQAHSVAELNSKIKSLAAEARAGRLGGPQMLGGSFTVSTLGRWGVTSFSPIISEPQVAILGVGQVSRVAREGADGAVRFVSELALTLVFDHRANDGVEAAQLLASIVANLENPERLKART